MYGLGTGIADKWDVLASGPSHGILISIDLYTNTFVTKVFDSYDDQCSAWGTPAGVVPSHGSILHCVPSQELFPETRQYRSAAPSLVRLFGDFVLFGSVRRLFLVPLTYLIWSASLP
jgi:hypothetical protein